MKEKIIRTRFMALEIVPWSRWQYDPLLLYYNEVCLEETAIQIPAQECVISTQRCLLGLRLETHGYGDESETKSECEEKINNLMYANITAPWSTFSFALNI